MSSRSTRKILSLVMAMAVALGVFTFAPMTAKAATGTMVIGGAGGYDLSLDHNNLSTNGWAWTANTNTLTLDSAYTSGGLGIEISCASTDTINLVYSGNVNVTGSDAIYCFGSLVVSGGSGDTLTLSGNNYGVLAANDVTIRGGAVNITATRCGISADNDVAISGGAVNITGGDDGIWAGNDVTISGGAVNITATIVSGIRASNDVAISGGTVTIDALVYGIQANTGDVAISGGSGTIKTTNDLSVAASGALTANGVIVKGWDGSAYTVASAIGKPGAYNTFVDAGSPTSELKNIQFITPAPIYSGGGWFLPPKADKPPVQAPTPFPAQGTAQKRISVYKYEQLKTRLFYLSKDSGFTLLGLANGGRAFRIEKDGREGYIAMNDISAVFGAPLRGTALKKAGAYSLLEGGKYKRVGYFDKEQILWIHGISGKYLINRQTNETYYLDAGQWVLSLPTPNGQ